MKNLITSVFFIAFFFNACTQSRYIKKSYAFSQIINAGIHLTDEKGNSTAPDSQIKIYIYLESIGTATPKITEVFYKGKSYKKPPVYFVNQLPVEVGINSNNEKVISLSAAKGNNLCRIELALPVSDKILKEVYPKIIVVGEKNGHRFSIKINKEIILQTAVGM